MISVSDDSSPSEDEEDEEEDADQMAEDDHQLTTGISPIPVTEEEKVQDPRESAFDIIKELQADIEFDKASQDSLERDLNIKIPDKNKLEKSDSEEDMDINTILSCLKSVKDEYKFPSSESESVKSEGPEKRVVRGKTKTKGELKAKPDLSKIQKTEVLKTRADFKPKAEASKHKLEALKAASPEQAKSKTESLKAKADMPKARVELSRARIDPGVAKLRPEPPMSKKDLTKSKQEPLVTKNKQQDSSKLVKDAEEDTLAIKESVPEKEEVPFSPAEASNPPFSNADSEKAVKTTEKPNSSEDEQASTPERPRGRKKKEPEEEKEDKNESPSKTRGKGRGKRRLDKDETMDSEEEPIKKKTRQKPKRRTESESDEKSVPPRLSTVCSDDAKEDAERQEENEWMNAPELTATPKLELEDMDDKDCDVADEPAPSLSPVHLRSSGLRTLTGGGGSMGGSSVRSPEFIEQQEPKIIPEEIEEMEDQEVEEEEEEEGEKEGDETVQLPKAFTSAMENTPPQTPEHPSNTPKHDNVSEVCSTRSEMEANLEVKTM